MDITKCSFKCPLSDDCQRFDDTTIKKYKAEKFSSWFSSNPSKIVKGKFSCDMFWGLQNDVVLVSLMDIFGLSTNEILKKWKKKKPKKK